jgi:hypothetical protein
MPNMNSPSGLALLPTHISVKIEKNQIVESSEYSILDRQNYP